ncbi:MAG TPA: 6-carboxytetrahydropterin synthase [Phycisphaerae bacterium]|jgi:6-pyruvoyltetrahydropterin/6-carboxytetrahydropterin synthase
MSLKLTRELRFGLHETAERVVGTNDANGFAANPVLADIAPFLTLKATVEGKVDPKTGMLVNIKHVDRILREHAVPFIRVAHYAARFAAPAILLAMMPVLKKRFEPYALTALQLSLSPFLSYKSYLKEPGMVQMSLRFEFSAAHRLHSEALSTAENQEVFGRCNNPNGHGHNYEIEVNVTGGPDVKTGEFFGVLALQQIVNRHIIEPFDHKHLNMDCAEFAELNPTVENIAKVLFGRLKPQMPASVRLASLRVWETPKTMCEYGE